MNISSIGAILNEVPTNESASRSVQTWFNDTFGSENVFELDDRAVVEHAIKYRTSLFEYDPDDAGYPWDEGPMGDLCNTYNTIAKHVEATL
jgi:hypothetical protein